MRWARPRTPLRAAERGSGGTALIVERVLKARLLLFVLFALAVVLGVLWFVPSNEYIFLPDPPRAVEPLVQVPGEKHVEEKGGIYMVDIFVRKASLLERIFPRLHEGASLVPAEQVNPIGVSESQRLQQSRNEMSQSQKVAAAVALRYLGYKVDVKTNGVEVTAVYPDAPADGKLEVGDVIVSVDGKPVDTTQDLRQAMSRVDPGETVTFGVRRAGGVRQIRLATEANPDEPKRAIVGVQIEQSATIDLPIAIGIDTGSIGGPSAGLAFSLDIVDELGQDIDKDGRIVVTGALDLDGRVGEIGGIKQKTIAARNSHADLFLVPDGNAKDARQYADGLKVVAVSSFREALSALTKR
jgi:PDZ domain-containing protein